MFLSLNAAACMVSSCHMSEATRAMTVAVLVGAEEVGPYPDSACQHEPEADRIMPCLKTMLAAAEVMICTLPDASQSSTGPTTVGASQQRRGAKSRQSSALLPAAEERVQVSSSASIDGLCSTILLAVG